MSTTPNTHLTATTPEEPPNAEASWHKIRDQEWKLCRFTSENWAVNSCRYEHNDQANVRCTVLEATLTHETGVRVLCKPFDPWKHQPGPTIYRKHRVYLRGSTYHDEDYVVTLAEDSDDMPSATASALQTRGTDPFEGALEMVKYTASEKVKATDDYVRNGAPEFGRGTNVKSIDGALWATIGAARDLSQQYQRNRQWFFGDKDDQ